jgi:UDPglucose--hexose-1-phosphate uridylyltransferase
MSVKEIRDILWAYRERMSDLERDIRFKYILIFKNHGQSAGASLEHSHSQLIAMPIVPKRIAEKIDGAAKYFEFKERCVFCDIIRQEIKDDIRIIRDYDSFIGFEPFASRFPFETCIIPKSHQSSFLEMSDADFSILAECLRDVLIRLNLALNNPPYNFMLCTRPTSDASKSYFHWHLEIIPKLTKVAGFEWGSGFYINPTRPEDAAGFLRNIEVSEYRPADRKTSV